MNNRGFFGIGIYQCKTEANLGTLWRSAYSFGASFIFTIGKRYKSQNSDTCKTWKHIPLFEYLTLDDFIKSTPRAVPIVGIELCENAHNLSNYVHFNNAIYLLGAEDHGLPQSVLDKCHHKLIIPYANYCLNVSVAGSIVMYDRLNKRK